MKLSLATLSCVAYGVNIRKGSNEQKKNKKFTLHVTIQKPDFSGIKINSKLTQKRHNSRTSNFNLLT